MELKILDVVLIVVVAAAVVAAVVYMFRHRGSISCDGCNGQCDSCSHGTCKNNKR